MAISLDAQINGAFDTLKRPDGAVYTHSLRGDMVITPFKLGQFQYGSVGFNGAAITDDASGGISGPYLNTGPFVNPGGAGAYLSFTFWGSIFGLRFTRNAYTDLGAFIDGVAYRIPANDGYALAFSQAYRGDALVILADDLDDRYEHHCTLNMASDSSGAGAQRAMQLTGLVLEKRFGYKEVPTRLTFFSCAAVPALLTAVSLAGSNASQNLVTVRQIIYHNTDSVARVVQIVLGVSSNPICWEQVLAPGGQAGSTAIFDPGGLLGSGYNGTIFHQASAAAVVQCSILGSTI